MLIYTLVNFLLLILSHLNTWRPISFRFLSWIRGKYSQLVQIIVATVVTIRFMINTGHMPDVNTIIQCVYGDGPPESVRADYRMNWLSFFLYQIVAWLSILLYES